MLDSLIPIFVTFLVVIDPLGVALIFAALTQGGDDGYRRSLRPPQQPLLFIGLPAVLVRALLLTLAWLLLAPQLMKLIGHTGTRLIGRLLGVILVALAVQFMLEGVLRAGLLGG